jgi:flagellar hook-associated protein 1
MSSLFYGLNIAKNALAAQTQVLNVTAHNVSNANTPGYSKQTVELASVGNAAMGSLRSSSELSSGSGVEAKAITRSRFTLYDTLYRNQNQSYNYMSKSDDLLSQVELLFNEPSDQGFSTVLNSFFNGWQDLAADPQNMAARQSLKSTAQELADQMHRINSQLLTMRQDIDNEISAIPPTLNQIAGQIANLNSSIRLAEIQGNSANDLRDRRDSLIDELSQYAEVGAVEQKDGTVTVTLGAKVIVEHEKATELFAVSSATDQRGIQKTVIRAADGTEYSPTQGKLGALINFRDTTVTGILDKFDTLAESLVRTINFEHENGYGLDGGSGRDFFDPSLTKTFNIAVSDDISDVSNIAASAGGDKGDGDNALRINNLQSLKLVLDDFTYSDYYNIAIGDIGVMARDARSGSANQQLLVNQVDNAREGVKGVSIDEELITMIQTQHVYQGASRLIVTLDSLLETLVNMK